MSEGKVAAGFYKGRGVAGSEQYATNPNNGNDQIAIDVEIPSLNRAFTTFLYFSDAAAPYAIDRLRACGWQGDDLSNLAGIDANEVDVQIKYEVFDGKERMKIDIATGGGRVKLENVMTPQQRKAFAARMKPALKGAAATTQSLPRQYPAPRAAQTPAQDTAQHYDASGDDIPF